MNVSHGNYSVGSLGQGREMLIGDERRGMNIKESGGLRRTVAIRTYVSLKNMSPVLEEDGE